MPIARHFTKRLRSDSSGLSTPTRTFSTRNGKHMGVDKISLPITLLSTTNTLSYDAPDVGEAQATWKSGNPDDVFIPGVTNRVYSYDKQSAEGSDTPALSPDNSARNSSENEHTNSEQSASTPSSPDSYKTPTLTDGSSVDSTPEVELNHLSCYFPNPGPAAVKRTSSARASNKTPRSSADQQDLVPALPKRAPSHSKKEHVKLARQRSLRSVGQSRASSPTRGLDAAASAPSSPTAESNATVSPAAEEREISAPASARTSLDHSAESAQPEPFSNPFSHELEKLDEVAEGYQGVIQSLQDQEDEYMMRRGLGRFEACDYMDMIGAGPRFSVISNADGSQEWVGWI